MKRMKVKVVLNSGQVIRFTTKKVMMSFGDDGLLRAADFVGADVDAPIYLNKADISAVILK